ncbi:MAG: phosphate acyltransferase PlsX [Clostridia bacterium]|nr:phosphate acyltransferase PlsX [Clostridia bacterium]
MRIAVDAFGGDNAPDEVIKGSIEAAKSGKYDIILVGNEEIISQKLKEFAYSGSNISVKNATEVIEVSEEPVKAVRAKKDSSMVVALNLCKSGEADAVVSAGSTGAYLAGAFRVLGRIKGIKRPALTAFMPNVNGGIGVITDCGATSDAKPEYLAQYGQMGSLYAEKVLGINNPKVYLANIGTEEGKGNELYRNAYNLLKENKNINFCGNLETRELTSGIADVIICDGFSGNMVIKTIEGTASALFKLIKKSFMESLLTKLSALVMKPKLGKIKALLDSSEYGGVPLLGIDGVVIKAHGNSDAKAFYHAIESAAVFAETGVNDELKKLYSQAESDDGE